MHIRRLDVISTSYTRADRRMIRSYFFFYLNKKRRLIILRFDLVGMVPHLLNHPACHTDVLFKEQEVYLPVSCCIWYCKGRLTQRAYTFITYGIRVSVTPHRLGLPFRKGGDHP